ncbi:GD15332 [Drosophila simulans]|uniref:GD15332 n=1 Tax=Drosophila simulans TaxID=7240 RepID=B4NS28_DROSI|nr:GD15332 [Drosophila simulans]
MARFCKKGTKCSVNGCQRRHHYLLHDRIGNSRLPQSNGGRLKEHRSTRDQELQRDTSHRRRNPFTSTAATLEAGQAKDGQESPHRNLSCVDPDGDHLLLRILPVDKYALLDEGSSVTLIDDDIIQSLNVKGGSRQLNVQRFGGKSAREHTTVVSLQISGTGKSMRHDLRNVFAVSNLNLSMQSLRREDDLDRLRSRTFGYSTEGQKLWSRMTICSRHQTWMCGVRTGKREYKSTGIEIMPLAVSHDNLLEKMVIDYFETENFGVKTAPPVAAGDDVRALRILEDTTNRVGRRYQTGLLWKDDEVRLPDSYNMALKRLVQNEARRGLRAYKGIMDDYMKKGYARRLEPQGITHSNGGKVWYLPHFGVENPNKPGKIRQVFDAAAKVNDISLNSALMKGPQRYKSVPAVLFRFREGAVGVCADFKEMLHQVLIQPQDRCAQRFLWINGEDRRNPDTYEMQVMTFGAA